jgi:hypothetical protein
MVSQPVWEQRGDDPLCTLEIAPVVALMDPYARREQHEAENHEGRPETGDLPDKSQGYQRTGYRADK